MWTPSQALVNGFVVGSLMTICFYWLPALRNKLDRIIKLLEKGEKQ